MPTLVPRSTVYEAYAGPETGGFGVVPQGAVPDPAIADEVKRWMFESGGAPMAEPPQPMAGAARRSLIPRALEAAVTPRSTPAREPVVPPAVPPEVSAGLAAQTLMPKGGVPRQASQQEARSYALGDVLTDEMRQAAELERFALDRTWQENLGGKAAHRYAEAGLALPSLALDVATAPSILAGNAYRYATGQPTKPLLGRTPQVTPEQVFAGVDALQGKDYNTQLDRYNTVRQITDNAFPVSSTVGKGLGDVATILSGRVPFAGAIAKRVAARKTAREARAAAAAAGPLGWTRAKSAALNNKFVNWAKRTGVNVGETGAEGAALAIAHDGDPLEMAMYAGTSQLAGSTLLAIAHHPVKSLIGSVVLWQVAQNVTPLEGKSIDWTAQSILDKATIAGGAGVVAGALGGGRVRGSPGVGQWMDNFPKISEAISGTLRTNANSLWEQITNDSQRSQPVITPVFKKLSSDVSAFKPDEIRRLERASMPGGDLTATILELSKNADFRKRMGLP